jgi:hypothetical protein
MAHSFRGRYQRHRGRKAPVSKKEHPLGACERSLGCEPQYGVIGVTPNKCVSRNLASATIIHFLPDNVFSESIGVNSTDCQSSSGLRACRDSNVAISPNPVKKLSFLNRSRNQSFEVCPDIIPVSLNLARWFEFAKDSIRQFAGNATVNVRNNFLNGQPLAAFGTSYRHEKLL